MIKRIQKLLGKCAMHFSYLSSIGLFKRFTLLLLLLILSSSDLLAGEISLSFSTGFLGTQGNNSNSTTGNLTFSTLGISRASFSQVDLNGDGKFGDGGTQGNDLAGTIRLYFTNGSVISLPGALNFRNNGGSRDIFGFIFDSGANVSFSYGASQTYTIVKGTTSNTSTSMGLRAYASSYTITSTFGGNAATSGLLDELNAELLNTPQPTSISLTNANVTEGQNLVFTVTLSATTTSPQVFTFSASGSSTSTSDYSTTYTFSNSVVNNGDGTITVPTGVSSFTITVNTVDDLVVESTETLILNIGSKSGTGNILDNEVTPTLTTTGTLKTFVSCSGCSIAPQSFTVSGSDLTTNDISVVAPDGVVVSTNASSGFVSSLSLTPTSGTVTTTTIFVKLADNATSVSSGVISVSTTGVSARSITVTTNTDNSLDFNGSNNTVNLGPSSVFNITTNFTIEAWVKLPSTPKNSINTIVAKTAAGLGDNGFMFGISDWNTSNLKPTFEYSGGAVSADASITAGVWNHVAVVLSGTTLTFYINGQNVGAKTGVNIVANTSQNMYIGSFEGSYYTFKGSMDNLRFWNVVKSQSDIQSNMVTEMIGSESNLIASYNFNQGVIGGTNTSITNLLDNTNNSLNGSLSSFTKTGSTSNFISGFIPEIDGLSSLIKGNTSTYTNGLTGGIWSSSNTSIATVNSSTGVVTAINGGSVDISYTICGKVSKKTISIVGPAISTSGTLAALSTCIGSASSASSFSVSASNLSSNLVLTAPTGYEISLSSTGNYSSTLTIAPNSGTISSTLIYVRIAATATVVSSSTISLESSGALTITVSVSGTVNAYPTISVTPNAPTVSIGSSVTLTATGATSYSWSPTSGLSASNTASVSASPTVTTTYTVTGTSSSCTGTASVTVTVIADTDGDGVLDTTETTDNTDPNDVCSYKASSQTLSPTSAWLNADCDGDGTPNGTDTAPKDPCVHTAGATPVTTNAIWRAADCDGDGVTNGKETDDGTDPNDGCSYVAASKTLTPSTAWNALDCDGDGTPNGTDTAPKDPCVHAAGATPVTTNAIWRAADCDGDGVTNAQEIADGTDPNDGCSYVAASKTLTPSTAWNALDCDGDGTPNATDTAPKDPCVYVAGATPVTTNAIWRAADCDGDGVTNGKEADDNTDPNNGCDYKVASRTLTPTAAWGILDCDADGNPNSTDPNIDRPTASNDVANVPSSGIVTVNILTNDDFLPGANTGIERRASPNDGTAKGTVSFNPLTGEMTYKRAPFETGLVTMGYKVTNNAVNPPVSSFAFVTILACDLADPLLDCDGDGELNGTDLAPTDPCVYEPSRQVKVNVSDDWKALDCDGDGVINGTELLDGTSASDACSFKGTSITLSPSAAWLLLDCDADGVTNQVEGTQDFDGDGIPNCLDTDSDGDSISDKLETTVDTDKDGKPDYLDLDSDNDGILDSVENKACTGTGILCDTDADGIPNFRDLDSDADQISDVIEASGSDYNKDGIADGNIDEKGIPSSANKGLTPPDTDRDGKLDPYDVDSDGDGILDFDEEYNEDADFADCDKDGIINRLDPDECDIFSPQGISPNGDGKNDRLVFKGLFLRKIPNRLSIFNRWGTLVFEMESYDNSFTGTLLPDGTYYYILDFFGKKPTISNYLSVDRTIK